jgi:hypothetical protein
MGRAKNIISMLSENSDSKQDILNVDEKWQTVGKYFEEDGINPEIVKTLRALDNASGNGNYFEYDAEKNKALYGSGGIEANAELFFSKDGKKLMIKPNVIIIDSKDAAKAYAALRSYLKNNEYSYL